MHTNGALPGRAPSLTCAIAFFVSLRGLGLTSPSRLQGGPKKPATAFVMFSNQMREQVKTDNPGISFTDIGRKLGEMWREMDAEMKKGFEDRATEAKDKYMAEKKVWLDTKQKTATDEAQARPHNMPQGMVPGMHGGMMPQGMQGMMPQGMGMGMMPMGMGMGGMPMGMPMNQVMHDDGKHGKDEAAEK